MAKSLPPNLYDCLEYPKTCAPDDFLRQVRRTINGKPISSTQLDLIHFMIRESLKLKRNDILFDLCCGNGFLSSAFFDKILGYQGVDLSPYLIEVANKNFKREPTHTFCCQDALSYCREAPQTNNFTVGLWYGAFAYFSHEDAFEILHILYNKFKRMESIFIGPIPDRSRLINFTSDKNFPTDDPTSSIGLWYTQKDFITLASRAGWKVDLPQLPDQFYQAHYRFNALLRR